jgi:hypothetical protein
MEKNSIHSVAINKANMEYGDSHTNGHARASPVTPKFHEIPLENVDIVDRPIVTQVAKAMLLSQETQCIKWCVEVLPKRPYNRIIVTYPQDTVFLLKSHLNPILAKDPGLSETPSTEYINEIWTEFKNECTNLVCRVAKKSIHTNTQSLGYEQVFPDMILKGTDVFDQQNTYIFDMSKVMGSAAPKKRKFDE